jgi:hypothetical protein
MSKSQKRRIQRVFQEDLDTTQLCVAFQLFALGRQTENYFHPETLRFKRNLKIKKLFIIRPVQSVLKIIL